MRRRQLRAGARPDGEAAVESESRGVGAGLRCFAVRRRDEAARTVGAAAAAAGDGAAGRADGAGGRRR